MPMGGIDLGAIAVAYARALGFELDADANNEHRHQRQIESSVDYPKELAERRHLLLVERRFA
jgi:hypothetical protein